jgi:hypothetical protein
MAIRIAKYIGITFLVLIITGVATIFYLQATSDGPIEPMQGGPFTTGEIVDEPVEDWSFAAGKRVEFELVGYGTSRVAGFIMHEGNAYMTCDLGFVWNRFQEGRQKMFLRTLYTFKRWHTDAEQDGRARLRIDGKIYSASFVKVEDEETYEALRLKLEDLARRYLAPNELPPRTEEAPNDVWFFRMDPV